MISDEEEKGESLLSLLSLYQKKTCLQGADSMTALFSFVHTKNASAALAKRKGEKEL